MEGTNINFPDGNRNDDHSYHGKGCNRAWKDEPPYNGGSPTACSTSIVPTKDLEDLSIGSYYNFQAATVGTGGSLTTENANAPDSFCPLGWQMPYGGTGGDYYDRSRSWRYLFDSYSSSSIHANGGASYPVSLITSGYYSVGNGVLFSMIRNGFYQSNASGNDVAQYMLDTWYSSGYLVAEKNSKYMAVPLRCVTRY